MQAVGSAGVGFIWIRTSELDEAKASVRAVIKALSDPVSPQEEPMFNVVSRHDGDQWDIVFIPRSMHRARSYFENGDRQILVSPAAIDLSGLVVVPRKIDFERLDMPTLKGIFGEVTLPVKELERMLARTDRGLREDES